MQYLFQYAPVAASAAMFFLLANQRKTMHVAPIFEALWKALIFILAALLLVPFAAQT
jgi:hypothetical protein